MQHEFSQSKALGKRQRFGNYVASPLAAAAFMFCGHLLRRPCALI
jgi:hypothetical protein